MKSTGEKKAPAPIGITDFISKFSGMTPDETLRYYSVPTIILSLVSFGCVALLSLFVI